MVQDECTYGDGDAGVFQGLADEVSTLAGDMGVLRVHTQYYIITWTEGYAPACRISSAYMRFSFASLSLRVAGTYHKLALIG